MSNKFKTLARSLAANQHGFMESSSAANKDKFHRDARAYLKLLATYLNLPEGSYEIRGNKAGPASLGEVTLHSEDFYMQLGGLLPDVLYRACNGRKDYTGMRNRFMWLSNLENPEYVRDSYKACLRDKVVVVS